MPEKLYNKVLEKKGDRNHTEVVLDINDGGIKRLMTAVVKHMKYKI